MDCESIRKSALANLPETDPKLIAALVEAAGRTLTAREIWKQRVSFVYGNVGLENPFVTREMVERLATEMYGPCP